MPKVRTLLAVYIMVLGFPMSVSMIDMPEPTETEIESGPCGSDKRVPGWELFMRNADGEFVCFGDEVDHYEFRN